MAGCGTGDCRGRDGLDGANGAPGNPGANGAPGAAGRMCWDLDGDGCDLPDEDTNGDGACTSWTAGRSAGT